MPICQRAIQRFKSFVVENDRYFSAMCLYIHGNPFRAGIVKNFLDYPWSSYPSYAASKKIAPWLTTDLELGGRYGASRKRFIDAQRAYVGAKKTILDKLKYGLFLGSKKFVNKWKRKIETEKDREKPQARRALKDEGISVVAERVFASLGVDNTAPPIFQTHRSCVCRPLCCKKKELSNIYPSEWYQFIILSSASLLRAVRKGKAWGIPEFILFI